jgi:hypothetical protein
MTKCVGSAHLSGKELQYYVQGNRQEGYRIKIVAVHLEEAASECISNDRLEATRIAQKIMKGVVFPENLQEIIDDYKFDNYSY